MTSQTEKILRSQLRICAEVWTQLKDASVPADRWLGSYFHRHRKRLGSRDRRFISEAIYSAFRHKAYLAAWSRKLNLPGNPELLTGMAAALEGLVSREVLEQEFRSFALRLPPEFYASFKNFAAKELGPFDSEEAEWSLKYSFPLWLLKRWMRQYGKGECEALLKAFQKRPPLVIRCNSLKISRSELLERLIQRGFQCAPAAHSPAGIIFQERVNIFDTEEFRRGLFEVQDEGSQILCEALAPRSGDIVWDVCAGGGGKSLALAALMKNKGRIIVTDIRAHKLADLKKRMRRAGAHNIYPADLNRIEKIHELREGADKILVDAPCSGTGTLRRNPDAKWKLTQARLESYPEDQMKIIENALPHLKSGGKLYYATCSLDASENEEVVERLLAKHSYLKQIPYAGPADGFLRLFPHKDGTDGFFLAIAENKK